MRLWAGIVLAVLLAAPGETAPPRGPRPGSGTANPSALVAAEIAFARAAREKGQWTAFRDFADDSAVMFVPEPVLARDWLKGRANPAAPVQWQAHQVWMSCDGSVGATKGAWQRPDGSVGYFTTIWQRRKKGDYRWVLDQGDALAEPLPAPEMLAAAVADCPERRDGPPQAPTRPPEKPRTAGTAGGGRSDDGTLEWRWSVTPDNARQLTVSLRRRGAMVEVFSAAVKAP